MTRRRLIKFAALNLLFALIFVSSAFAGEVRFHILMVNDPHSYILPFREASGDGAVETGGLSRALWLLKAEEEKIKSQSNSPLFLVEAGDTMLGRKGSLFSGEPEYSVMAGAGFDVGVLGNHDFDGGAATLAALGPNLKFPVLASNITFNDKKTDKFFPKTTIIKRGGVTIGFFGLVTPTLPSIISDSSGFAIRENVIAEAKKRVRELQSKNVDVIVAVNHIGLDYDIKLAKAVPGIHVIVGGHSHDAVRNKVIVPGPDGWNTLIGQAGLDGRYVGRFDVVVKDGRLDSASSNWKLLEVTPETPELKSAGDIGRATQAAIAKCINIGNPVAVVSKPIDATKGVIRFSENYFGDELAEALRRQLGTRIGFANSGTLRIGRVVPAGPFSPGDMLDLLPFDDTPTRALATGAEIRKQLEISASVLKGPHDDYDPSMRTSSGEFLQMAGLRVTYDLRNAPALVQNRKMIRKGERVTQALVEGADGFSPLEDDKVYSVAGLDFTFEAWDVVRANAANIRLVNLFDMYVKDALHRKFDPATDGRIKIIK